MPAKRQSDAPPDGTPQASKVQRTDHPGDFSGTVKKKLSGTTRTGQACDRCKVRKIRCDARPGGCSPCIQNNTECKTTDRITGRATTRGHTETLEAENNALKQYIAELQAQLQENGIEARPPPVLQPAYMSPGMPGGVGWGAPHGYGGASQGWNNQAMGQPNSDPFQRYDDSVGQTPQDRARGRGSLLPDFRLGCIGDNYLGVASANELLSTIKGSSLALFGMDLDLADFMTSEADDDNAPASYKTFLRTAFNRQQPQSAPPLPPYEQCKIYCQWFFMSIHPFTPVLDRSKFMDMVERLHKDPSFQPTMAETVQLHMVLATMMYQYGKRNTTQFDWSPHYLYAISFLQELIAGHTLPDMQALALICLKIRNFAKPGPGWFMSSLTLTLAIEMGLHRSVKAWKKPEMDQDPAESDLRKRVFWTILMLYVNHSMQLGRPLGIRLEDMDVEFPEPMQDSLPGEEGLDDYRKCSYRMGLAAFRWVPIAMQVHSLVYSVRTPSQPYETTVRRLEKDLESWREQLPAELRYSSNTRQEDRVFAAYLEAGALRLQLLLHHPSVSMSSNQDVNTRNTDICLEASSKLLEVADDLRQLKSLAGTWQDTTILLAAIFTTLFAYTEKKDQITSADLNSLKESMDVWLVIMGDIGELMGSGTRLQTQLSTIISTATGNLSRHLAAKTASAAVATANIPRSPIQGGDHSSEHQPYGAGYQPAYQAQGQASGADAASGTNYLTHDEQSMSAAPGTYPSANQFAYPDPANPSLSSYASAALPFENQTYQEDIKPDLSAQLAAHNASLPPHHHHQTPSRQQAPLPQQDPQAQSFLHTFGSPPQGTPAYSNQSNEAAQPEQQTPGIPSNGPAAWRHFTDNMMNNMSPQDYLRSANALIALGQKPGVGGEALPSTGTEGEQSWPMMVYGAQQGNAGQ